VSAGRPTVPQKEGRDADASWNLGEERKRIAGNCEANRVSDSLLFVGGSYSVWTHRMCLEVMELY
jgi:hypothetical protein